MRRLRIETPSRLHFGLLSWGPESPRQFGGVGLMIDAPGIGLTAEPAPSWGAEGPSSARVLRIAEQVSARLAGGGTPAGPAFFRVHHAPEEHVGLGVGTQLSLAVAQALVSLAGLPRLPIHALAGLAGRGLRSGIGLHGFARGGLVVDGGRRAPEGIPPLLAHHDFPADWAILLVLPERMTGLHGRAEVHAFAGLPPISRAVTDRLCRLVLLGLLPAIVERDLTTFGAALAELQQEVGQCFAPAQGGIFASPELAAIAEELQAQGLHGVGQSSWGPTLYGFSDAPPDRRTALLAQLRRRFGFAPDSAFWTLANRGGATLEDAP